MKSYIFGAAFAAALSVAVGAQAANLVLDGDFSNPSGGGSYVTYGGGSTMGPWLVTGGSVDLIGGYWQSPTAGGGSIDLDGGSPGGLSQSLSLGAGNYVLTYFLSGNPDGGAGTKTVSVAVGGGSQTASFTTGSNTHADMMYIPETLNFTATGPTTLTFTSLDGGGPFGPVIGGVSITAVPEPAAWILMIGGFGLVGIAMRRRQSTIAA
ncbi:MAG: PEPxxWA-CTERM sorting domain-containing protein [Caulobacteraceae bacterium]